VLAILIRGSNEVASAVAHQLFKAGFPVGLHDEPRPDTNRRSVSFADCAFDGEAWFDGVKAVLVDDPRAMRPMMDVHAVIPMAVQPIDAVVADVKPDILIDARMRKREHPESQMGLAPLTMGLGPNFVAGGNADLVVETGWGDDMGHVYDHGSTRPLEGDPHPIGGHSRDRFIYARDAGLFRTHYSIGQMVTKGEVIGAIDGAPVQAPLTGKLRGLTHDGTPVKRGTKVVEVDPRGAGEAIPSRMSTRPSRIAAGILAAVQARQSARRP
jgi:xanthine dehydrogenase accessory factor